MDKRQSSFVVAGLTRNGAKNIRSEVERLECAVGKVKELNWLIIESDSEDGTPAVLEQLKSEKKNFRFISLGRLRNEKPLRTDRISFCRNTYLQEIKDNEKYSHIDYIIVADLDNLNTHLNHESFSSCWNRDDWGMCAANQNGPYYDIWALRHKIWNPDDCWKQFNFFNSFNHNYSKSFLSAIVSKMIKIPIDSDWIEVDSAFGGLAIYQKDCFISGKYKGVDSNGNQVCEHVYFHKQLRKNNYKLFINPKLINANYTEHTKMLRFPYSFIHRIKRIVINIIIKRKEKTQ